MNRQNDKLTVNVFRYMAILYIIIGAVALIGGDYQYYQTNKHRKEAVEITATISRMEPYYSSGGDRCYHVYIDYYYDGVDYKTVPLNYYNAAWNMGDEITVYLGPDEKLEVLPLSASSDQWWYFGMILFGAVFFLVGMVFYVVARKLNNRKG